MEKIIWVDKEGNTIEASKLDVILLNKEKWFNL